MEGDDVRVRRLKTAIGWGIALLFLAAYAACFIVACGACESSRKLGAQAYLFLGR